MGKFGKKNSVSMNPLDYNITILGESGIGKTTLAKEMCEDLVGDEGYIHLDIGREDGASAIEGIISEKIEDWAKLKEVVEDIVENKAEEYPDLKVVIWDTFDELIMLAESETIRQHNKKNPEKRIDTILSAMGGFGRGQDYASNLILEKMDELRKVGVSNIIIGHVKRTDITDPITQETYSKLTADTTQRYFNSIKNKQHFVALAYIDREIVEQKTGRKNVVTKEEITINKAISESRVISFRDNTFSVDSKSRFADIVDRVPFDVNEFIKAMKDAIEKEKKKSGKSTTEIKKEQKSREAKKEKSAKEYSKDAKENKIDEETNLDLIEQIKEKFATLDDTTEFKALMKEKGVKNFKPEVAEDIPTKALKELLAFFD